jgi:hypothetical protein
MRKGKEMTEREWETQIDRLVDGELSAADYRQLVAALDDEPGGWRRCALAFLEAQALRQELPGLRRSLEKSEERAIATPVERARAEAGFGVSWLAIAASFLVAFSLGLIAPRFFARQSQDDFASGNLQMPDETLPSVTPVNFDPRNLRNIGNLQLVADDGAPGEVRQVPVYESEQNLNDALTGSFQGALPPMGPDLIDLLRGHGYDVRHEQQYVPATLEDGRQMIVPLEGYQITPVSRRY